MRNESKSLSLRSNVHIGSVKEIIMWYCEGNYPGIILHGSLHAYKCS